MSERICEKCEKMDFGIWGPLGAIGYSFIVGGLGYVLANAYFDFLLALVIMIMGLILWLPMYLIATKAEREINRREKE